jgi:hypothetical protein
MLPMFTSPDIAACFPDVSRVFGGVVRRNTWMVF